VQSVTLVMPTWILVLILCGVWVPFWMTVSNAFGRWLRDRTLTRARLKMDEQFGEGTWDRVAAEYEQWKRDNGFA
jgi:hypothetical protein